MIEGMDQPSDLQWDDLLGKDGIGRKLNQHDWTTGATDPASLRELIGSWIATHRLESTQTYYSADISRYLLWALTVGVDPLDVRPTAEAGGLGAHTFTSYEHHLRQLGHTPATVNYMVAAVSSFYKYAHMVGSIPRCPRDAYRSIPVQRTPLRLSAQHAEDLLQVASEWTDGPPGRSLFIVRLLSCDVRPSAMCRADVGHLDTGEDDPHLLLHPHLPRRRREVPLDAPARAAALAYLAARDWPGRVAPLLASAGGTRLSTDGLRMHLHWVVLRARIPLMGPDELRRNLCALRHPLAPGGPLDADMRPLEPDAA